MSWFYISFATKAGHRGSTVVEAADEKSAIAVATMRGLCPGGEAMIHQIPPEKVDHPDVVPLRYRLASKAELMARGAGATVGRLADASYVCEDCIAGRPHVHH